MSRNEAIKRMGELLLSGWRMLATTCPICHSPIMSKDGHMLCPGCNVPVLTENDRSFVHENASAAPGHDEKKSDRVVQESNVSNEQLSVPNPPQSMEELRKEYDHRNARRNKASDQLGQYLLRGWVMLQDCCPNLEQCNGTPLVREQIDGSMLCVSCSTEYLRINNELVPALQVSGDRRSQSLSLSAPLTTPAGNNVSWLDDAPILPLSSFSRNDQDDSWKISQKLIQGWRLLDQVCESDSCSGAVPLVMDKQGKIHCVSCGMTRDGDTNQVPARNDAVLQEQYSILSDEDKIEMEVGQLTKDAFQKHQRRENSTASNGCGDEEFALRILRKKLRITSQQLEECEERSQAVELVDDITKLASAIKAVKDLLL